MYNVSKVNYLFGLQEYQENNKDIVISEAQSSQTIYIYSCKNSTIQVQGKINSMVVGKCTIILLMRTVL